MGKQWFDEIDPEHFWFSWRFEKLKSFLNLSNLKFFKNINILEVGMGTGIFRKSIENYFDRNIDGADLDNTALECSEISKGNTYYYDINDRHSSLKGEYDLILLFDVLEHIENEDLFLKSIKFHLALKGKLLINVPAYNTLYSKYDEAVGHFRRYNLNYLNKVLTENNFKLVQVSYWGMFLLPLLLLRKLFINKSVSNDEIITKGFRPPNKFFSYCMKKISYFEILFFKRLLLGSSLMALYELR